MRIIVLSFFLCLATTLSAQLNEKHQFVDVKQGETEVITINSVIIPTIKIHDYSLTDSIGFNPVPVAPNTYELNYKAISGYLGDISTVIEYTEPSSVSGISQKNYTVLNVQSRASRINAIDDNVLHDGLSTTIDVLSNDTTTEDSLTIAKIGYVSGGTASITSDNKIDFSPSGGKAYINYYVQDDAGTVTSASLILDESDNVFVGTQELYTQEGRDILISLPSGDYGVVADPSDGELQSTTSNHVWKYIPDAGFDGVESLQFTTTSGGQLDIDIKVLNVLDNNSSVVDDELYLVTDGTITFDVLANDYNSDAIIVNQSSELTDLGNGVYQYTSTGGFTGDLEFEYVVFTGTQVFTGDILIHVADFAPVDELTYNFQIIEDQDLIITHQTPVGDFILTDLVNPSFGTLQVLDEFGVANLECDTISGANTLVYTPDSGFTGTDEFDIEYCTGTGICEILKVDVFVQSSDFTDCLCLEDCVYAGDHNDDGRVDVLDILDLGLNAGEGGDDRSSDFTEIWTGQFAPDWGYGQIGTGVDLKCGDSDGDGFIDAFDMQAVADNYGNIHRLQSELTAATSDIPVYFIPQQTAVDSGELLLIDIIVGDSSFPALDMNGLAFSFNIDASLIDSSTVDFNLSDNTWMGHNSPLVDFVQVPEDGQVDIAVTRLGNNGADGIGIIGTLEFIVEDEIEGLRRALDNKSTFTLKMDDIVSTNKFGEQVKHPDYLQLIKSGGNNSLSDQSDNILLEEDLYSYPNPTSGLVNLTSRYHSIDLIEVYDVLGHKLSNTIVEGSDIQLDLSNYDTGLYFIKVHSQDQTATVKIHKVQP